MKPEPEHKTTPYRVGKTLLTNTTRQWSKQRWKNNEKKERQIIFANFHENDEGRARIPIAKIYDSHSWWEITRDFIIMACNSHDNVIQTCKDLLQALDNLSAESGPGNKPILLSNRYQPIREQARRLLKRIIN